MKLLKGTKPLIKVSGSYNLLRPMGNPRGTCVYNKNDKVYALYEFSTDVSSTGDLPDLGPRRLSLHPSGSLAAFRPEAPIKLSGSYGGDLVSSFALGFPTHQVHFNDGSGDGDALIRETTTTSDFSFVDGDVDKPFSISAWYVPKDTSNYGLIASKYRDSAPIAREYRLGQSGTYDLTIFFSLFDESTNGQIGRYSTVGALTLNEANHVLVTYDGSGNYEGINFYINGVLQNGGPGSLNTGTYVSMEVTSSPFCIGHKAKPTSSTPALDGNLAQVCLWSDELTSQDAKALYEARLGVTKFGSGVVSLSGRIQLAESDQRAGEHPAVIRTGDPRNLVLNTSPFDDTSTIMFRSSFSESKIRFCKHVKDGDFIDLTGSLGKVKRRFVFIKDGKSPHYDSSVHIGIPIMYMRGDTTFFNDSPYLAAKQFVKALLEHPLAADLKIDPFFGPLFRQEIDETSEYYDPITPTDHEFHQEVTLRHFLASTGSFAQGNVITAGRASTLDPPAIKIEQFSSPMENKINFSSKEINSTLGSSLVTFPNITPDIVTSGTIAKGISDANITKTTLRTFLPFVENRLELRNDSEKDNNGLKTSVLRGFNSSFRSKIAIPIELNSKNTEGDPIYFSTGSGAVGPLGTYEPSIANVSGSGIAYWSHQESKWQHLDVGTISDANYQNEISDPFSRDAQERSESCLGFSLAASSSLGADTEFVNASGGGASEAAHNLKVASLGRGYGIPTDAHAFPWGIQYNATGSQEIKMSNYIKSPFLLQGMRVYVEGVFGVGTSTETLRSHYPIIKNLFILNQTSNGDNPHTKKTEVTNVRKSDGAGSTVPESMSVLRVGSREIVSWAKIGFVRDNSFLLNDLSVAGVKNAYLVAADDFDSLQQFNASSGVAHVTSSFSFDLSPKSVLSSDFISTHPSRRASTEVGTKNSVPIMVGNSLGGANLLGEASGRQIGFSLGGVSSTNSGSFGTFPTITGVPNLVSKKKHYNESPYLLNPTDRLVIGWQNINMRNNSDNTMNEQVEADQLVDKIKSVKIVLYGSHVRRNVEYIPSMDQNLTTNQIYESILGEPLVDKFDVESLYNLSGSTSDALFFGEMKVEEGASSSTRGRRASIAQGQAGSTGSLSRNIGYTNKTVKYKDSLAPPISHVVSDPAFFPTAASTSTSITVGADTHLALVLSVKPTSPTGKIFKKVGFFKEDTFLDSVVSDIPSKPLEKAGAGKASSAKVLAIDLEPSEASTDYSLYGGSKEHIKGVASFGSPEIGKPPAAEPVSLKGSDGPIETSILSSIFWAAPTVTGGASKFPLVKLAGKMMPAIKMWKHGFWSGIPMSPKHYFDRSEFGHFRNMVEQPPEAYVNGLIAVTPIDSAEPPGLIDTSHQGSGPPVYIRFFSRNGTPDISPLDTNTQNLSQYATSSMPYYDGLTVERDVVAHPPPDLTDVTSIEEAVLALTDGDA